MDMTAYALKLAGVPARQLFASGKDASIRAHLARNHEIDHVYADALHRPIHDYRPGVDNERSHDGVDLYVAGPPCQPWSQNNIGASGIDDPRGRLFQASIDFIIGAQPRASILENVCGMIRSGGGRYLQDTLGTLRRGGYHVRWERIDALRLGLPHSRPRLYVWGFARI